MPAQIHILWTPAPVVSKVQFNQRLQFHQLFREAFQMIFLTQSVHSSEGGCWPRGIRRRKPITCWTKGWLRELLQCAESSTVQSGITATKNQEYHKNMIRGSSRSKNRQDYVIWCMYMHVHVCIHILHTYSGMISKKIYAVPFDPLWSALLPAKTLKDPKFGAAGAVLSSISKYFKDMFQGCPPPVSLAFSLVPGAKNAAKKPKEDESCCNSQRFTVKWRRCESFCRQNGPEIFTFWSLEKDRNEMPSSREKYNLGQILTTWMEFYCVLQRTLLWGGTWQGSLWIMKRPYQIAWHPIAHSMLSGTFTCPYTKLLNFSAEEVLNK